MKRHWQSILVAALLVSMAAPFAQGDKSLPGDESAAIPEKEMAYLVSLCEGCHGVGGKSSRNDVPALAGRDADELFDEIERFYFYERVCPDVPFRDDDGSKGHMSMCDVVNQMNKQEARALAEHFEKQSVEN